MLSLNSSINVKGQSIKITITIKTGEGVEKKESTYTVGGNVNWYSHCGEQYGGSLRIKDTSVSLFLFCI